MSVKLWSKVLSITPLLLPYLQGYLGSNTETDRVFRSCFFSIVSDVGHSLNVDGKPTGLCRSEQLRTSLRLLFHRSSNVRRQGFTLSINQLTNYDKENNRIVNYTKSTDTSSHPENIFIFDATKVIGLDQTNCTFDSITQSNVTELWNVLRDESVIENLRWSAAEQIALITQDINFHGIFVENGFKYVLNEFNQTLDKEIQQRSINVHSKKYLLSLIKILKHLTYMQSSVRHMLCLDHTLLYQLFRLVLVCYGDFELRFHASCILCLLLYDDVIIINDKGNLTMPVSINLYAKFPLCFEILNEPKDENRFPCLERKELKHYVKTSCFLTCHWFKNNIPSSPYLQISAEEMERMKEGDFRSILLNITKQVCAKPTNHCDAIERIENFKLLLGIIEQGGLMESSKDECIEEENGTEEDISCIFRHLLKKLFAGGFIKQVLQIMPCQEDDFTLYARAMSLIDTIIQYNFTWSVQGVEDCLISATTCKVVQDSTDTLSINAGLNFRALKQCLVTCLSSFLSMRSQVKDDENFTRKICDLVKAIYKTLSITGSESYYDLPLMEFMMECLMHLLSTKRWSLHMEEGHEMCIAMFHWLSQILVSFHMDRVGAAVSFMGKGIVQKSVICLCHLLHEIKLFTTDENSLSALIHNESSLTSTSHLTAVLPTSPLPWLLPLLSDRMIDIRLSGWAISTALVSDASSREIIINEFQNLPGGLWAASLGVILDEKECFAIRSQASSLLASLVRSKTCEGVNVEMDLWQSIVVQDSSSKMETSGVEAFLLLLDHFEFFNELRCIFSINKHSSYSTKDVPTTQINASTSISMSSVTQCEEALISSSQSSSSSFTSQINISNRNAMDREVTSSSTLLPSSLLQLIVELINLSPKVVFQKLIENQSLNVILSSWSHLLAKPNTLCKQDGGLTKEVITVLELLHKHDVEKWRALTEQYEILNNLELFFRYKPSGDISRRGLETWNKVIRLFALFHQNQQFHDWFTAHALKILSQIYSWIDYFVNRIKVKENIPILENFLRFTILLIRDTVLQNGNRFPIDVLIEDNLFENEEKKINICVGEQLFHVLLKLWTKSYILYTPSLSIDALKCLFMCSSRAKQLALDEGFVETLIEELKDKLVKLKMECALSSQSNEKINLLNGLSTLLQLVCNFMLYDENVKLAFLNNQFVVHLQNVWSWSSFSVKLTMDLMSLLTVMSANCEKACVVLSTSTSLPMKQMLDETCFVNYVVKILIKRHEDALKVHAKQIPIIRPCFEVLTNTIQVPECRAHLFKVNLSSHLTKVFNLTKIGNKQQKTTANFLMFLWLRFYAAFSSYLDGAKFIGKTQGILSILLDNINQSNGNRKKKEFSLVVIRNLMFVPTFKQSFCANKDVIGTSLLMFDQENLQLKLRALSIFNMVLNDNEKGKGILKKVGLEQKLLKFNEELKTGKTLTQDGDIEAHRRLKSYVENTLLVLTNE